MDLLRLILSTILTNLGENTLDLAQYVAPSLKVGQARIEGPTPQATLSLIEAAPLGSITLSLNASVPGNAQGFRLVGTEADEVIRIVQIEGSKVSLLRPTGQDYPAGTTVKVL